MSLKVKGSLSFYNVAEAEARCRLRIALAHISSTSKSEPREKGEENTRIIRSMDEGRSTHASKWLVNEDG